MAHRTRSERADRIRHLLETEGSAIHAHASASNARRRETYGGTDDLEELRTEARSIKEAAIDRLPELIETVREAVEEHGGTVYVADDAADANAYVADVVNREAADGADGTTAAASPSVVKSKSMTTEEIDLNDALEADGIDVTETDLASGSSKSRTRPPPTSSGRRCTFPARRSPTCSTSGSLPTIPSRRPRS